MVIHSIEKSTEHAARRRPGGQNLVEYALIVPFFLLLLMAVVDLGRVTYFYATLNSATREGSRWGVVQDHFNDSTGVEAAARAKAITLDPGALTISVTWDIKDPKADPQNYKPGTSTVQVTATYTFNPLTPLAAQFLFGGNPMTISNTTKMVLEQ